MNISIGKAAKVGTYPGYKGGRSTQTCEASLETVEGITFQSTIWGRYERDNETGEENITFTAGFPKGVTVEDETTKKELEAFIEAHAQVWSGWPDAMDRAIARLTNTAVVTNKARIILHGKDIAARKAVLTGAGVEVVDAETV